MVDSINGAGGPQNLTATNRAQNNKPVDEERTGPARGAAAAGDEVRISQEALALQSEQQAEQTAKETRTILQEQLGETLSADRRRVDKLL
ncbi:MAG: hypothetical protein H6861_06235 [Rhodospirillales bacterium]|nr:hypothetical protein [Rhodospirillales bacterium]